MVHGAYSVKLTILPYRIQQLVKLSFCSNAINCWDVCLCTTELSLDLCIQVTGKFAI